MEQSEKDRVTSDHGTDGDGDGDGDLLDELSGTGESGESKLPGNWKEKLTKKRKLSSRSQKSTIKIIVIFMIVMAAAVLAWGIMGLPKFPSVEECANYDYTVSWAWGGGNDGCEQSGCVAIKTGDHDSPTDEFGLPRDLDGGYSSYSCVPPSAADRMKPRGVLVKKVFEPLAEKYAAVKRCKEKEALKEALTDYCWSALAIKYNDASFCKKIVSDHVIKNCQRQVAK